jgi:hypothetical protein
VFSRNVNAPRPRFLLALAIIACTSGASGCKLLKKKKAPPVVPSTSTATTQGAALTGVPMNDSPPPVDKAAAPPVPVDPLSPADHALIDQTKGELRDVEALVKRGLLTDPAKPDGDVTTRCTSIEGARPKLETLPDADGELKKIIADTRRLCSFEVPLLNCNHALRQASLSPSQASHRLMCGFAQKDFDKVRKEKPNDRRTFELGQRFSTTCK